MNSLGALATALLVSGGICTFISLNRYSDFIARLCVVDKSSAEKWTLEWTTGENWSNHNINVAILFWRRDYLSLDDEKLVSIGASVRKSQIVSILLIVAGLISLIARDAIT